MKKIKWFFGILFVLAALVSCNEDMLNPDGSLDGVPTLKSTTTVLLADGITSIEACGTETVTLWAGQTINAGTVVISNDATNLYVTINSTAGFQQVGENIKMWLGTDLGLLDGGGVDRPSAGRFPYKATLTTETSYTFTIPLQDIPGYNAETCGQQKIYVVVHADVLTSVGDSESGETAWGGDLEGTGSSWWFNNEYTPSCCLSLPPTPDKNLETAFAKPSIQQGGYVFVNQLIDKKTGALLNTKSNPEGYPCLNLTQNRWGWATNLAIAEDIIPPTLNYDLLLYHSRWFGGSYNQVVQNVIHITNDETNLYVTVNFNLSNSRVYVGKVNTWAAGSYVTVNGLAGWNTVNTYTVPLNTIPNYTTFGTPIYVYVAGDYGTYYRDKNAYSNGWIAYTPILPVKGTADYPIYAGAGLNDITKGVQVGTAYVQYNGTSLSVKYDLDEGYEMEEVHVYANDAAPLKVAPGQFEFIQYFDPMVNDFETVFDVPDTNGDGKIWIILHAVVDLNIN